MPDPGLIYRTVEKHRRELLAMERNAASAMVREYGQSWQNIRKSLDNITSMIADMRQAGEEVPPSWLFQRDRLKILLAEVQTEIVRFVDYAEPQIRQQQQEAVQAAERHSQESIGIAAERAGVIASFAKLQSGAVEDLIGFSESGPLRELFDGFGTDISLGFRRELVDGLLLGRNPREITRRVRKQFATGLARTLRISRTETLRAYREATRRNYQANSDILEGWEWLAAKQARTCPMCLAMDGTFHTLDERLNDHPNGRCTTVPRVKGMPRIERESAAQWFEKQDEATQAKVLGRAGHEAYKGGAVKLDDFIGQKRSKIWGTTRYARSLKQILGAEEADKFKGKRQGEIIPKINLNDWLMAGLPKGRDISGARLSTQKQRMAAKEAIISELSKRTGISEEDVNAFIKQWAYTSNDNDMRSLMIQKDAAELFGVELSDFTKERIRFVQDEYGYSGPESERLLSESKQKKLLREMKKFTEEKLREAGYGPDDTITLYRGVKFEGDTAKEWKIGDRVQVIGNPLESWTVDTEISQGFSEGSATLTGVVFKSEVKIKDIVGTARTGFGCLNESEFVVNGRNVLEVEVVAKSEARGLIVKKKKIDKPIKPKEEEPETETKPLNEGELANIKALLGIK